MLLFLLVMIELHPAAEVRRANAGAGAHTTYMNGYPVGIMRRHASYGKLS